MRLLLPAIYSTLLCVPAVLGNSIQEGMSEAMDIQREALSRMKADFLGPVPDSPVKREKISSTISFKNPKAQEFLVDGTKIPEGTTIVKSSEYFLTL